MTASFRLQFAPEPILVKALSTLAFEKSNVSLYLDDRHLAFRFIVHAALICRVKEFVSPRTILELTRYKFTSPNLPLFSSNGHHLQMEILFN